MSYTVTHWSHNVRVAQPYATQAAAQTAADALRVRSDALLGISLVPIRVLPTAVYAQMERLRLEMDTTPCRHHVWLRLCVRCLQA